MSEPLKESAAVTSPSRPPSVAMVPAMVEAPYDVAAWEAERAERKARRDANRDEMEKCLSPAYAAARELEKPVFKWRVEASWRGVDQQVDGDSRQVMLCGNEVVIAQNEADAWAQFCDRLGTWPSRHHAKPKITKLEQISASDALASVISQAEPESEVPVKTLVPMRRPAQSF